MTPDPDQHIDDLINRHEASWRLGYDAFPAVLNKLGLKRGAEIGVAFGGHSEAILQNTNVDKLYAIDSYLHRPEYDDPMNLPQPVFDRLFERTGERLSAFGNRIEQIRLDSVDAAKQIDEPLDFVYIDGDHSYAGIRADLEAWFPLIREGGIIAGHDYGQPAFPGVKAAADHFFNRFGLTVTHEGKGVWWALRPATTTTLVITAGKTNDCDATLYDRLRTAGLTERDTILLVHDDTKNCDAVSRALAEHANTHIQAVPNLRGPWHATATVLEQITTPIVMPIDVKTHLIKGQINTLRDRLCHSGAMACLSSNAPRTNDFTLTNLLNTADPAIEPGQAMFMTTAVQAAWATHQQAMQDGSERLIPWLCLADALATGGRAATEPSNEQRNPSVWPAHDCRTAAEALTTYAPLIDGTDLLRLKWPAIASQWLNQLSHKPIRTRNNVNPVDTPPTYDALRLLDRVVHKVRRTIGRAA